MTAQTDFPLIFEKLKAILKPYSAKFTVKEDGTDGYSLEDLTARNGKKNFSLAQLRSKRITSHFI